MTVFPKLNTPAEIFSFLFGSLRNLKKKKKKSLALRAHQGDSLKEETMAFQGRKWDKEEFGKEFRGIDGKQGRSSDFSLGQPPGRSVVFEVPERVGGLGGWSGNQIPAEWWLIE